MDGSEELQYTKIKTKVELTFHFIGVELFSPRHDEDEDEEDDEDEDEESDGLRRKEKKKKKKLFRRGIKMAFPEDVQSSSSWSFLLLSAE